MRPHLEVRSRRVGGATYQVPVEVRAERAVVEPRHARRVGVEEERVARERHGADARRRAVLRERDGRVQRAPRRRQLHRRSGGQQRGGRRVPARNCDVRRISTAEGKSCLSLLPFSRVEVKTTGGKKLLR